MKQSQLFFKTLKETPTDADSINASYLERAGFVKKHMAGVYALLPLGLRVIKNIEKIIREELDAIGGQEILMNVLQPKELWDETGRWQKMNDIFYKIKDEKGKEFGLAPTHEEQVTDIVRKNVKSYRDLPKALYQIQTKFRNEPRPKSGLLRGREFMMKDMYSFHLGEKDFLEYYQTIIESYFSIFEKMELEVKLVEASGGVFSEVSHEFQVLAKQGEDEIFYCDKCKFAQNKEIAKVKDNDKCPKCDGKIRKANSIEVGNIFPLGKKFSTDMGAKFIDEKGEEKVMVMGCYGIGITRSMAAIVELYYDITQNKMTWPEEVAPYQVHLISLRENEKAKELYERLKNKKIEVLFDDREISAGQKFAEADLIGCPKRIIVSEKSLVAGGAELLNIKNNKTDIIPLDKVADIINDE